MRARPWAQHKTGNGPAQGEHGADGLVLLLKEDLGQEAPHQRQVLGGLLGVQATQLQRNGCRCSEGGQHTCE